MINRVLNEWFPPRRIGLISVFVLSVVVLTILYPTLTAGFWADDYIFFERAGREDFLQYLSKCCDLRFPGEFRRLAFGIQLWGEYQLFGANPQGYRSLHLAFHFAICVLIWIFVGRITGKYRAGLIAGLVFAGLPLNDFVILWISNFQEITVILFYWLAMHLWLTYLRRGDLRWFYFTLIAAGVAFAFKQTAFSLPLSLFLMDRLIGRREASVTELIRRYALFVGLLIVSLLQYLDVIQVLAIGQTRSVGTDVLFNFLRYLVALLIPVPSETSVNSAWLWGVVLLLGVGFTHRVRSTHNNPLAFLGLLVLVTLIPFLSFFSLRYLYLTSSVFVIFWAFIVERLHRVGMVVLALVLIASGLFYIESSEKFSVLVRADRAPFRDISQQHSATAKGTLFYLIDAPTPMPYLSGMFFFRYGTDVILSDPDNSHAARLRDHPAAYVYYFDDSRRAIQIPVQREARTDASLTLPVDLAVPIRLQGYEITGTNLKRGDAWGLFLYWQAKGQIEKDYTVFMHLVDERGETVLSADSQPRDGRAPTSSWQRDRLVVDPHILTIPPDLPRGTYRVELGMYYLPTLERLAVDGSSGNGLTDRVVIQPLTVID